MKNRLRLASAAMLMALLASFVPLAGSGFPSASAATLCDAAQFVSDVNYADGSSVAPGLAFKKTWKLKNIGTCTWSTSYTVYYVSGEKMGTVLSVAIPAVTVPGSTVEVSVDMVAPTTAGTYQGNWQLKNAAGVAFGIGANATGVFWVKIVVPGTGSVPPTTGVAYNFANKACDAKWTNGKPEVLPCPGTDGDARGFVLKQANPLLENGVADSAPGLLVSPQPVANGYIRAEYPAFRVERGDKLQATVSCEANATACYVAYRIDYETTAGVKGTIFSFREKYERQYYRTNIDLSFLAGQDVKFSLYVTVYGSNLVNRALWGNPVIYRSGTSGGGTTPPPPSSGCDKAQFVEDLTIPDGKIVAPGEAFKKTWKIKNVGTCTWTTSYQLVFFDGNQMGGASPSAFQQNVAPGATVELNINLVAPTTGGKVRSSWMFKNAQGQLFGVGRTGQVAIYAEVNVSGPTATPGGPPPTDTTSAYDFVAHACDAETKWVSGAGALICPSADGDAKGFVLKITNPQLETGAIDPRPGLLTNPQNTVNGYIQGKYPEFSVQNGDRFKSVINCQFNAGSCNVVFRLDYQVGDAAAINLFSFGEKYEGKFFEMDVDLSKLAGQKVKFILTVTAGTSAVGDRALWVAPRIFRPTAANVPAPVVDTTNWSTQTLTKFTFKTPPGSVVDIGSNDTYVKVTLPFNVGTTLVDKFMEATVREGLTTCGSADAPTGTALETVVINGLTFNKQSWNEGAGGNAFNSVAYSILKPGTTTCASLTFFLKSISSAPTPVPPATAPPAFDKNAESAIFQTILSTFAWK